MDFFDELFCGCEFGFWDFDTVSTHTFRAGSLLMMLISIFVKQCLVQINFISIRFTLNNFQTDVLIRFYIQNSFCTTFNFREFAECT